MVSTRNTSQRLKILEYLRCVKSHPNAETVYNAIKKDLPAISLATVYRNLNLLANQGVIWRLEVNNEFRFDGDTCHHQHCVCDKCGKLMDVFQEEISKFALKNFKFKEFTPSCVSIIFSGVCKRCSKGGVLR